MSGYEGYYASIFYRYFTAPGLDVIAEDTTNKGRRLLLNRNVGARRTAISDIAVIAPALTQRPNPKLRCLPCGMFFTGIK